MFVCVYFKVAYSMEMINSNKFVGGQVFPCTKANNYR